MKIITIGRESSCNIILNHEMISRNHAMLKLYPTGRMEIIDYSVNGTYVNGIRISKNVPVPVRRKDTISFAKARQLDWSLVPDPMKWIKWAICGIVLFFAVITAIVFLTGSCSNDDSYESGVGGGVPATASQSAENTKSDSQGESTTGGTQNKRGSWWRKVQRDDAARKDAARLKKGKTESQVSKEGEVSTAGSGDRQESPTESQSSNKKKKPAVI